MSLQTLIIQLENKEITPTQLVLRSINRINELDSQINAVVQKRFEQALKESTQDYSKTKFKGIPILLKCLGQDLKGEPSTAASHLLKDSIASTTSHFVQKCLDLGFIVLGQTNSCEFGFKNITDSKYYGDVKNPVDQSTSPGGSSGGAAAALVMDYVPVVSASDGGGSIRIPASYTNLIGLKPTRGSMPTGPTTYRGWQGASINFFLTKTIEDTILLFDAMKENIVQAPFNYVPYVFKNKYYKIAYSVNSPVNSEVSKEAKEAVLKTVNKLKALGHEVTEIAPDYDGLKLMEAYYIVNGVETVSMMKAIEKSINRKIKQDDIELMSWAIYQYGLNISGYQVVDALNLWDLTSEIMHQFHHDYDLFLTPTTAKRAPDLDYNYFDQEFENKLNNIEFEQNQYEIIYKMFESSLSFTPFTMLANMTGQPAISLPLFDNQVGVQFMAAKGNENLLFEISRQLVE